MWDFFYNSVVPIVLSILLPLLVPFVGLLSTVLFRWLQKIGVQLEANDREAFQTAITNAAKAGISKMGGPAATNTISAEALKDAVKQVQASVPDAVKRFKVDSEDIAARIKPQAEIIAQSVPTVLDVAVAANPLINVIRKL